ncbi:unnamed protein product [Allacma fusca]|uniref:Uncharacterized protein n=1 Tax=Allacma fusca TaxID=39272 RepID=A0A8J2NJ10_9HEXA|nr:unnamed protein product [Allacma fusca]
MARSLDGTKEERTTGHFTHIGSINDGVIITIGKWFISGVDNPSDLIPLRGMGLPVGQTTTTTIHAQADTYPGFDKENEEDQYTVAKSF